MTLGTGICNHGSLFSAPPDRDKKVYCNDCKYYRPLNISYISIVSLTFCMSSSSCRSSSLVMLYCCSSTRAKYSMARMDSLSFRVKTISWNGEKANRSDPLGQMFPSSQIHTGKTCSNIFKFLLTKHDCKALKYTIHIYTLFFVTYKRKNGRENAAFAGNKVKTSSSLQYQHFFFHIVLFSIFIMA